MSSRHQILQCLCAGIVGFLVGCGAQLGDENQKAAPIALTSGCLTNVREDFKRYWEGRLSVAQIESLGKCAERSIDQLKFRLKKDGGNYLSFEVLWDFLERYPLQGKKISKIDREIWKRVKTDFLKESHPSGFSNDDFDQIKNLVSSVFRELVFAKPIFPIQNTWQGQSIEEIKRRSGLLGKSFVRLGRILGHYGSISVRDVFDLMDDSSMYNKFELFKSWKYFLLRTDPEKILEVDWEKLFEKNAKPASLIMWLNYFTENKLSMFHETGLRVTGLILENIDSLMTSIIQSYVDSQIPLDPYLDRLADAIVQSDLLPWTVDPETVRKFYRNVLLPIFDTDHRPAEVVTMKAWKRIMSEAQFWKTKQESIEKTYIDAGGNDALKSGGILVEQLFDRQSQAPELGLDILRSFPPLYSGGNRTVSFLPERFNNQKRSFHNYSQINWMLSLYQNLIRGYGENDPSSGLTKLELNQFYLDVRDLGIQIDVFDPRVFDTALKRFEDGNLFMNHSDDNDYLSVREGVELFAVLVSTRMRARDFHHSIALACPTNSIMGTDLFGLELIEPGCYREQLFTLFHTLEDSVPSMTAYYSRLQDIEKKAVTDEARKKAQKEREQFERDIDYLSRRPENYHPKPPQLEPYESSETEAALSILFYVESMFSRFDIEQTFDGTIDTREALIAFDLFKKKLAKSQGWDLEDKDQFYKAQKVFTFILAHGRVPDVKDYLGWGGPEKWKVKAERGGALRVISLLKEMMK